VVVVGGEGVVERRRGVVGELRVIGVHTVQTRSARRTVPAGVDASPR
jgi:hypothetical protein